MVRIKQNNISYKIVINFLCLRGGKRTKKRQFIWSFILVLLCFVGGCGKESVEAPQKNKKPIYDFTSPTFSKDNNKIIFGCCKDDKCNLATYELSVNKLQAFNPTGNQYNVAPAYSYDGKQIVFTSGNGDNRNVYVMDSNGKNVRQLTHQYNNNPKQEGMGVVIRYNSTPSFSPDGKRIIFVRSGLRRQRSVGQATIVTNWDVFEVDIATGVEKKLTDYKFYTISSPYYLPDGKKFIFSGDGPGNNTGVSPNDFHEYYRKAYQKNNIFVMDEKNKALLSMST